MPSYIRSAIRSARIAATAAAVLCSASAHAATDPTGIWLDHNGRGAVEIKQCASGRGLCGHVVNVKDPANASRCGLQILGEVTPDGGGWIYSPERKQRYDVALKRLSDDKLRVVGNAGSRFFSKTFTWNRAPGGIVRCDGVASSDPASVLGVVNETPMETAPDAKSETQPEAKPVAETPPASAATAASASAVVPTGARTGSAALLATTPAKTSAVPAPATGKAPEKMAEVIRKTVEAADAGSGPDLMSISTGSKRTCKYRVPYIGRTISVPCRD